MTARFYDELAPYYHLLYGDWDSAIDHQGAALAALLQAEGVVPGDPVLDAACGIGTQTLGLASRGYRVCASDISPGAVARLEAELTGRALSAHACVDDLRTLARTATGSIAAVLACDNSIPHLLSDAEILQAFRSCHRCLRPDGVLVISVRDYAAIERKNPDVRPYGLRKDASGTRFVAVQAWEWDGDQYDLRLYLTSESTAGACETRVLVSRYYAVSIARLTALMHEAGFVDVQRRDDVLFQPVLVGRPAAEIHR
jgi:SAM-dependent methyltransferase